MKKKNKSMNEVSKSYETFIKGKELNSNGAELFNKVIKKTVKPKTKQRGSK